jgi:hypothetical protein
MYVELMVVDVFRFGNGVSVILVRDEDRTVYRYPISAELVCDGVGVVDVLIVSERLGSPKGLRSFETKSRVPPGAESNCLLRFVEA